MGNLAYGPTWSEHVYAKTDDSIPGEWPKAMLLRVQVGPEAILRLMYAKAISGESSPSNVPRLEGFPSRNDSTRQNLPSTAWDDQWIALWSETSRQERAVSNGFIPPPVKALSRFSLSLSEEAAYTDWRTHLRDPADEHFERQRERALVRTIVPAWQAGLRSIFILPIGTRYTFALDDQCMVVSATTRDDDAQYASAIRAWRAQVT